MTRHKVVQLALRKGSEADMPWLYDTFKRTMQKFIDSTWGWDELMQSHSFSDHLPAKTFAILSSEGVDVAALNLRDKPDHLWLEMILVLPEFQGRGYGRALLEHAQTQAVQAQKPLRLSVLKLNPAQEFYRKMGFEDCGTDQWSLKMQWLPQT